MLFLSILEQQNMENSEKIHRFDTFNRFPKMVIWAKMVENLNFETKFIGLKCSKSIQTSEILV